MTEASTTQIEGTQGLVPETDAIAVADEPTVPSNLPEFELEGATYKQVLEAQVEHARLIVREAIQLCLAEEVITNSQQSDFVQVSQELERSLEEKFQQLLSIDLPAYLLE